MPANDGKDAERAFEKHWTTTGHCQRLRDKRDLIGLNGGKMVADFAKPSDFIVSSVGHMLHYAEVKSTKSATSFAFGGIQPGQHIAATLEAERGQGAYRFYIFSYALGRWFVMSCREYTRLHRSGRRSIKFEELTPWNI